MNLFSTCMAILVIGLVTTTIACGPSAEEQMDTKLTGLWDEVQSLKGSLDEARAAVDTAAGALAQASEEGVEDLTALQAGVTSAEDAAVAAADAFNEKLIGYLNEDAMIEGEPPTERQLAAIRLKSDEDLMIAQEFIDKGGNYKRAIDIYEQSMMLDPDNGKLAAALASAEEMRYMTQERLSAVKKKMTEDEVRELLGPVNLNFIKKYDDRGVTAWFYPREDGGAAAVFFEEKGDEMRVYDVDYDATKPPEEAG